MGGKESAKPHADVDVAKPMPVMEVMRSDASRDESKGKGKGCNWDQRKGGKAKGNSDFAASDAPRSFQPRQPRVPPMQHGDLTGHPMSVAPAPYPCMAVYAVPYYPMPTPQYSPHLATSDGSQSDVKERLLAQLEYYFDVENLCKDVFLRQHMNEEGWVQLGLIANFNKVKSTTTNGDLIVEVLLSSSKVELDQSRTFVRLRDDWQRWLLSPGASLVSGSFGRPMPSA